MYQNISIKTLLPTMAVLALSVSLLTACGGGDDAAQSTSTPATPATPTTPTTPTTQTGVLQDSPVINIGYRTETQSGVTNALGEYEYIAGESVTFFIGDLVFPTVSALPIVTPLNLAGTLDAQGATVSNMLRLIQTLDKDGNLDNGITIDDLAKSSATAVDFSLSEAAFEASSAVMGLINNAGLDTPISLISKVEAIAHFEDQMNTIMPMTLAYSLGEIAGVTHYSVVNSGDDGDCPIANHWSVESISYEGGSFILTDCTGVVENGTYTVVASGLIEIIFSVSEKEYIKRTFFKSVEDGAGEWADCYEDTEAEAIQCTDSSNVFTDKNAADSFAATQNNL